MWYQHTKFLDSAQIFLDRILSRLKKAIILREIRCTEGTFLGKNFIEVESAAINCSAFIKIYAFLLSLVA